MAAVSRSGASSGWPRSACSSGQLARAGDDDAAARGLTDRLVRLLESGLLAG